MVAMLAQHPRALAAGLQAGKGCSKTASIKGVA
jgi:hypothetical protein